MPSITTEFTARLFRASGGAGAWTFAAIGDYGAGTEHLARVAANLLRSPAET